MSISSSLCFGTHSSLEITLTLQTLALSSCRTIIYDFKTVTFSMKLVIFHEKMCTNIKFNEICYFTLISICSDIRGSEEYQCLLVYFVKFKKICQRFYTVVCCIPHIHTHTHTFNGPLSGTTRVSRYQKGKPIWILLKQETVSGSGISWAICKSAPCARQITTPAPHYSIFYRPDALPAAQPTASKH